MILALTQLIINPLTRSHLGSLIPLQLTMYVYSLINFIVQGIIIRNLHLVRNYHFTYT